ncbi:ShlB/FhaC/HecB family hemolysin secretion/activation protein [Xenorhabdus bovienii]|uniref:ShlB/FhaC/HecB family hemolysin secretion/activation protein n=1 Tax=Xenorhabdus bovienii TaxID=40576 RepID=UPI00237C59D4|nr:ShlB/FhaC/HecB family hemolysin secretion/activation protein [Xenorhabdus bovienii]MDE1481086.1 ShlB/FhaC/HecB family hemolysin secretion/activation protein [Xenorhabdus bovienii]MDE9430920.1 ShlB/FhaC/HecB family hemolysin secretion/activation protein [Xenorhabdus bovienii]MDE9440371.1 ShlB/FhaC/HecB family hemolysin secretion/activation protein [Xenorhabdus bovienii]MDE9488564.1 ShlB/FhaC/HecB family hemolysin secretion/activation protein [Xenorhabdus bovienii]MDE9504944.1 ShlB/FhaC/HecB 
MFIRKIINLLFYWTLIFSSETIALSNNISPADQEVLKQKQKEILEESQKQQDFGSNLEVSKSKESSILEDNLPCQIITNISINNAQHFPKSNQEALIKQNISKCMTSEDISSLVGEISTFYMEKGYITSRAFLRQQDVSDIYKGNLIITVVEGKIDKITINNEEPLTLKMVFPNMKEKILNLRDIEQGLDQLNRLHSYQVKIDIRPSGKAGYSDIVLEKISSELSIGLDLGLDNSGQKSKGRDQLNISLQLDNVLHLADSWTFYGSKDLDFRGNHRTWYISSGVSIPYGYWLFNYQYSKNESYQDIPINDFWALRYIGKGQSHSISANRTLYRDGKQKLGLNMSFTSRKTENILGDFKLSSGATLNTLYMGFNYNSTLLGGYFRFNPAITKGLSTLGATKDDNFKNTPKSKFHKFSGSLSYYKPLTKDIYYFTSVYGQYSLKNLYSSERLSIGGLYSVRGFKEQYITGNSGGYWRNELNWKLVTIPKLGELSLNGSLDTGWLKEEIAKSSEGGNLTGTSLGLTLNNNISNHSITIGKPLIYPKYLKPDNLVIYWSASINF